MIIGHPNISYYHWETTFDTPNMTEADQYLSTHIPIFFVLDNYWQA